MATALLAGPATSDTASNAIHYSFDDALTATGPDTFQIFEHSSGSVSLSDTYRHSGYRSVRLTDSAGSKDFPEVQGYFPLQKAGRLTFAFYILFVDPNEELNIALAGPAHFNLAKDGIAFWLQVRDGSFYHMSDSIPKRLGPALPFVWYGVRVSYDIDRGRYDLLIEDEYGQQPAIEVSDANNATNHPGSAVRMFSFIGDLADRSNADYYVDDIALNFSDNAAPAFAAPGRRKLFVEYWRDAQKALRENPVCVPALSVADFGLRLDMFDSQQRSRLLDLLAMQPGKGKDALLDDGDEVIQGIVSWHSGCHWLTRGNYDEAAKWFTQARRQLPQSRLIQLSYALSLAGLNEWDAVDHELTDLYPAWWGDERWVATQGMIALRRRDYPSAAQLLAPFENDEIGNWLGESLTRANVERMRDELSSDWWNVLRARLLIEQRFYLYIWQGDLPGAAAFAAALREQLSDARRWAGLWWEWEGNVYLLMDNLEQALQRYQAAVKENQTFGRSSTSVSMKLADVYFLKGDFEQEKHFRELVYGTLD